MTEKWCESWEKNFDSSFKIMSKFKDDLKERPPLPEITEKRVSLYLDLLLAELEEIKDRFHSLESSNRKHRKQNHESGGLE